MSIRLRLLRHDEVLPGLPEAAQAGRAPDLHFFWNGIYLVDSVWRGLVAPLEPLFETSELDEISGGPQSRVGGLTYRAGWYVIPVMWVANRRVLEASGVDRLPTTWDELVKACVHARAAGFEAITVGDGEGDFSVWWLTHFLTQELDDGADAARLVLGELDWRDTRYWGHWRLLADALDAGFLDAEALPLTLWDGLVRFNSGRSAFTLASGPMFASCRRALGAAAVVFVAPATGRGRLAGVPIVDTQGIGISSSAREPAAAAALLRYLHRPESLSSLWEDVRLFPADRRWRGPEEATDPDYLRMWAWHAHQPHAPYIPNLMPLQLHYRLAAEIGTAVMARSLPAAVSGEQAWQLCREWREGDARRTSKYRRWVLATGLTSSGRPTEPS